MLNRDPDDCVTTHLSAPALLAGVPVPIVAVGPSGELTYANHAAEQLFAAGSGVLTRQRLADVVPFGSPILALVEQARRRGASVAEHDADLSGPRLGEKFADVIAAPADEGHVIVTFQERGLAQRLDRQLIARDAARSTGAMSAVLAHEIKNPLAGIRGAAQLLEDVVPEGDRMLAQLIRDESDRIRALIDRMESFGDSAAIAREKVNIHEVLGRVRQVAEAGFARGLAIVERYDPSLPAVSGDRDRLIQAFMNLVRNAADACPKDGGEIVLSTAYRPGVHLSASGPQARISLPLEVTVRDNGAGIAPDLMPHIFDPFVTTKAQGAGLGLALVAKIVADHGGVVDCDSVPGRTAFRVRLPVLREGAQ